MRALNNPNIIRLHEVFETDNSLYMVLDLLEGGQLYDKIKAKYRLKYLLVFLFNIVFHSYFN